MYIITRLDEAKMWWFNGKCHRIDGPAIEYADGAKDWFVNGKLHRLDGPACEYANRRKEWHVDYKNITSITHFILLMYEPYFYI